jgi:hypothetical protein
MALPIVRQQNPSQIRVPIKDHAKQIKRLTLVPIPRSPNSTNRGHVNVSFVQQNLQPDPVVLLRRE